MLLRRFEIPRNSHLIVWRKMTSSRLPKSRKLQIRPGLVLATSRRMLLVVFSLSPALLLVFFVFMWRMISKAKRFFLTTRMLLLLLIAGDFVSYRRDRLLLLIMTVLRMKTSDNLKIETRRTRSTSICNMTRDASPNVSHRSSG